MIKLSDYVVRFLEVRGVRHIFMLTGGGCMHLVNSVGESDKIEFVCNHHEQSCAMAAEAYAKLTNDIGVVLVTSGPGGTNTITGLAGAYQDSVPCLFISGQSKRSQTVYNSGITGLRQFGVQEINIVPIVESVTKYVVMVNEPERIRYYLEKAFYLAKSGRPGPVWIDIPLDVQSAFINEDELVGFNPTELKLNYKTEPGVIEINDLIGMLKVSKRPVIIAGHGITLANAQEELNIVAEKFGIPVVTPIMGIDVMSSDHRNYVGRIGTKGTRAGNFAMQNADLILSIGSRLSVSVVGHEYALFAREAKIVVVDIDPEEHKKKTITIHKFINSDAKAFLNRLLMDVNKEDIEHYCEWLDTCNKWKCRYPVCLPEYEKGEGMMNLYYFVDRVSKVIPADVPVISDAGSSFYAVSQAVNVKKSQRYITSGALATMGFGLPAAIGVCAALGRRPVITITGDGSFQQNIQELQTVLHYELPIKIFVINNNGYLSIRQTQRRFFDGHLVGEGPGSGVSFPLLKNIAAAYGMKYFSATYARELNCVLNGVFDHQGPVLCEVNTLHDQQIIPTNSAAIRSDGTMISKPLEDMYPFLDRDEFRKNMTVKPVKE